MRESRCPDAIFFDLDGTLIDTAPDMGGALNIMLQKRDRPAIPADAYRSSVSHGTSALLNLGFSKSELETDMQNLRAEFLSTYDQNIAIGSVLFDGVTDLLESLEEQKIPWGIVTNKPEALTLKLLDTLKLTERCCSIVAADTTTHAKPHPAPMNLACKRASVRPDHCFYIGDTERDIEAGRAVAMKTFVASWGYIDDVTDTPEHWGADAHLATPLELLDHLGE